MPVTEAKGQLTELVRRTEAGDEVILTRHGHPSVRLVPIGTAPRGKARGALLEKIRASAALRVAPTESNVLISAGSVAKSLIVSSRLTGMRQWRPSGGTQLRRLLRV